MVVEELRIDDRPELRDPILIAAFSGWNDAGEAATSAARFMFRRWKPPVFAEIEAETFYDFTQARPTVKLEQGGRVLEWPPNKFSAYRLDDLDFDVILLQATEPHLRWHSYMEAILTICREFNVGRLITLGALLLAPAFWAVMILAGRIEVVEGDESTRTVAMIMLASWPISLFLIVSGVIFAIQVSREKKAKEAERAAMRAR